MGCWDCGAVELECEDYPDSCPYSSNSCVCDRFSPLPAAEASK